MHTGWLPVADGISGVREIVRQLGALKDYYGAQPVIRAAAIRIAGGRINDDNAGNVERVADFVRRALVYVKDPVNAELVQTPDVLLAQIARRGRAFGDCDDHVLLFASLAESLGLPTRIAGVKIPGTDWFNHVICVVDIDGEEVEIDLCAKESAAPVYSEKLFA